MIRIANLALIRVGITALIASLDEATTEARVVKALWASARDGLLASHSWRFATKREPLAEYPWTPVVAWAGAFALPADCLVPLDLWAGSRSVPSDSRSPFEVASSPTGSALYTDASEPILRYVARVEDANLYTPHFSEALAWRLACDLVLSLPVKPTLAPMCFERYRVALSEAIAADLRMGQDDSVPDSPFITVRG